VRFRRQVVPGDEMTLRVTLDQLGARGGWGTGQASVGATTCCEARLFFVVAPMPAGAS